MFLSRASDGATVARDERWEARMRLIYTGLSIALVIHTGVHAAQSQPSTQATPAAQGAANPAIKVTGCLQSSAAAGLPGAATNSAQFVLTKVIARTKRCQRTVSEAPRSCRGWYAWPCQRRSRSDRLHAVGVSLHCPRPRR